MDTESVDSSVQITVARMPPVDVPQHMWQHHPALRDAQLNLNSDGIEWPTATFEQLSFLRKIALVDDNGTPCARLSAEFNFDWFVNTQTEENAPAYPPGHTDDRQRYYTRVTASGFHFVGVFCASTVNGRRRYFQWLTSAWAEIGLGGFLHVRDALDTHYSEISGAQLEAAQHVASVTPVVVEEGRAVESVHNQFADEPTGKRVAAHRLSAPSELTHETDNTSTAPMDFATQQGIAVAIATIAHRGDVDYAGASSIDHVARVAESFDRGSDAIRYCVAWLHDVLEVGNLSERDLLDFGVSPEIVKTVSLLTKNDKIDEDAWLEAIAGHPDARAVKLQSVADNSAVWRLRRLEPQTRAEVEASCARARSYLAESDV